MWIILKEERRDAVLAEWRGARARLWVFNPTFSRLAVQLSKPLGGESLYVVAVTCVSIRTQVHWDVGNLRVEYRETDGPPGGNYRLYDEAAGFEVVCGGVLLFRPSETGPWTEIFSPEAEVVMEEELG
jgi:hypothetical protein